MGHRVAASGVGPGDGAKQAQRGDAVTGGVVKVEHHHVAAAMTGEANTQRWRRRQRHRQALQVGPHGLQSVVVGTHNNVEGIDIRCGGDLPLISSPPLACHGGPRASSGMSGQRHPHGLSQPIFDDGSTEPDFQVDAARLGDRVEVIDGLIQGAEDSPHYLGVRACLRLTDPQGGGELLPLTEEPPSTRVGIHQPGGNGRPPRADERRQVNRREGTERPGCC
ncbi:MAG: hypothetical protein WBL53_21675 [Pseudonocardiaceae bacterium]